MSLPGFYFSEGPYHPVLQGVYQALSGTDTFIKLTGEALTGKSTLCEKLCMFLEHKGHEAFYINYPFDSPAAVRQVLASKLELPDVFNFPRQLEEHLCKKRAPGRRLLLVFDDCHKLSDATLLELYRLTQIQFDDHHMLAVLLCGEPELDNRLLGDDKFRSVVQHVTHSFILTPMDRDQLRQFSVRYFEEAGNPGIQLEAGALKLYLKLSAGLPGNASTVCDLIVRSRKDRQLLTSISKDELVDLVQNSPTANGLLKVRQNYSAARLVVIGPTVAVIMVLSVGFLYQLTGNRPSTSSVGVPIEPVQVAAVSAQGSASVGDSPFIEETAPESETSEPLLEPPAEPLSEPLSEPQPLLQLSVEEIEEPIIDLGLALVTALERGIDADQIVVPLYEEVEVGDEVSAAVVPETAAPELVVSQTASVELEPEPLEEIPLAVDNIQAELVSASEIESITSMEAELFAEVQGWIEVWAAQDVDAYLGSYHEEFIPRYQNSVSEWRENRRRNISAPEWIRLDMTDFNIVSASASQAEVTLWLEYQSPDYRDSTFKRLVMRADESRWLIAEEINLEVRR